jgi:methionine-gamma-lyase
MIAFEMRDGYDAAALVMQHVRLITPAVSLGSTDSLIQHPASLTHRVVDAQARASTGIDAGLLRLSVGLEHVDDLWRDLTAAFAVTEQRRRARAQPSATVLAGAT